MRQPIVYLAAAFPKLSETFVYREVLGLRRAGVAVKVVSLRPAEEVLGEDALEALKAEVIPLYGAGVGRLVADAARESIRHPLRSGGTLGSALWLACTARDLAGCRPRARTGWQAVAALALAARLRPLHPALLHAHMAHAPTTIALFTARQLGIPFSFTGHAADLFRDRALLIVKLRRALFVNCISYWHRAFYQELVPRPATDYPVVRCGVDESEFPARPAPPDPRVTRLLAAGRLVPKKGFDLLFEALAHPLLREVPWRLRLVGAGPEEADLRRRLAAHPCRAQIALLDALPNEAVRREMAAADVFVLPCRVDAAGDRDGIPVVLMEAMAAGAAVISGDLPTIRELIDDGRNGLFVAPGDAAALAAAIHQLCTAPQRRAALAAAGRQAVGAEFALGVNVQRMVDHLESRQLVGRNGRK